MAKFLTGNELNFELEKLFERADSKIILISPYIKLHDRYLSTLKTKLNNDSIEIIVVFGKNEDDLSKSMKQDDFNFFKQFPNLQIRYEKRLHAKYYANEDTAILTSMNLYDYSQNNNIEAGVMTKATSIGISSLTNRENIDAQAYNYFERVIEQSDLLFQKKPHYENTMLGLAKKYMGSKITVDKLTDFFTGKLNSDKFSYESKKTEQVKFQSANNKSNVGYCIRTGAQIPFNPKRPLSDGAYKSWAQFSNQEYSEKFCHFSGEPSHGETCVSRPILKKNWKTAKDTFGF